MFIHSQKPMKQKLVKRKSLKYMWRKRSNVGRMLNVLRTAVLWNDGTENHIRNCWDLECKIVFQAQVGKQKAIFFLKFGH